MTVLARSERALGSSAEEGRLETGLGLLLPSPRNCPGAMSRGFAVHRSPALPSDARLCSPRLRSAPAVWFPCIMLGPDPPQPDNREPAGRLLVLIRPRFGASQPLSVQPGL
jgi:hypothetical protein